jgi:hypothetical protein
VTTPPSKGLVVELYLIYFGLAQSFVDGYFMSSVVTEDKRPHPNTVLLLFKDGVRRNESRQDDDSRS